MKLKLHFNMQNEKNINNRSSEIHQFYMFFLRQQNIGTKRREEESVHLRMNSVALAITNWILFPFYKSQFSFYVFVSSMSSSSQFWSACVFQQSAYWIRYGPKAQYSASEYTWPSVVIFHIDICWCYARIWYRALTLTQAHTHTQTSH